MHYCDFCAKVCGFPETDKVSGHCVVCRVQGECNDTPAEDMPHVANGLKPLTVGDVAWIDEDGLLLIQRTGKSAIITIEGLLVYVS